MTLHCRKSNSDQHVFFTYVCLVNEPGAKHSKLGNDITSFTDDEAEIEEKDDQAIRVEKSKALHELVETHKDNHDKIHLNTENSSKVVKYVSIPNFGHDMTDNEDHGNPNLIKLTKMKWLTEKDDGTPDSSMASLSVSSIESADSQDSYVSRDSLTDGDRCLSTILKLDEEHNLFGLSRMATALKTPLKKFRPIKNDKPVFHQTQIVQVCCADSCCEHKSNTNLPCSLQCIRCNSCCFDSSKCNVCTSPCPITPRIVFAPKTSSKYHATCKNSYCRIIQKKKSLKIPRSHYNSYCNPPIRCGMENSSPFGLKVYLDRKIKYDVAPTEISPKSSSILQKPFSARPCNHNPRCTPPSGCFPYLMPCFWPSRPSAPCTHPNKCFHNPPCPPPICPKVPPEYMCPHEEPCANKRQCMHNTCVSKNERVTDEAGTYKSLPRGKSESRKTNKKNEGSKDSQSDQSTQRNQKSSSKGNKTEQNPPPQQPSQAEGYADMPTQVVEPGKKGNIGQTTGTPAPGQDAPKQLSPYPGAGPGTPYPGTGPGAPYPGTGPGAPYPGTGPGAPYPGTGQGTPYPVTPYTGTEQLIPGANEAAKEAKKEIKKEAKKEANQDISQAAGQASQGINQAANQAKQDMNKTASQASQDVKQAAKQGTTALSQAPNQVGQGVNQAAGQINQATNQAVGQANQAANQAVAQGSQLPSTVGSQASQGAKSPPIGKPK